MACIIKLKHDTYIEWSKASDSPAGDILNAEEVKSLLQNQAKLLRSLNKPFNPDEIFQRIESTTTSDPSGGVDLNFILKYNTAGPHWEKLTLDEIISYYSKK